MEKGGGWDGDIYVGYSNPVVAEAMLWACRGGVSLELCRKSGWMFGWEWGVRVEG